MQAQITMDLGKNQAEKRPLQYVISNIKYPFLKILY